MSLEVAMNKQKKLKRPVYNHEFKQDASKLRGGASNTSEYAVICSHGGGEVLCDKMLAVFSSRFSILGQTPKPKK